MNAGQVMWLFVTVLFVGTLAAGFVWALAKSPPLEVGSEIELTASGEYNPPLLGYSIQVISPPIFPEEYVPPSVPEDKP